MTNTPDAAGDAWTIPAFLRRHPEPRFHPLLAKLPMMGEEELDALAKDIEANGLMEVITIKDDMIVDGRNRYLACKSIDYKFKDEDFVELPEGYDVLTFVISRNYQRLHLSGEQKRELIEELLATNPNSSSRAIAALVHVSHHTVEDVRQEMGEATGQSAQLDEPASGQSAQTPLPPQPRIGRDGRRRRVTARQGAPKPKDLKKQVDNLKAEWETLNKWQQTYFVNSFKDEIVEILEEIEKRQGTLAPTGAETSAPVEEAQAAH